MVEFIHYFIKNPIGEIGGLVYPTEVENNTYYTIGSFYIIGKDNHEIQKEYIIHAIKNDSIIKLPLKKSKKNSFDVTIDEIGKFTFLAENVSMQKYSGGNPLIEGAKILKRLRIAEPQKAELACRKYRFYFTGYSETINKF